MEIYKNLAVSVFDVLVDKLMSLMSKYSQIDENGAYLAFPQNSFGYKKFISNSSGLFLQNKEDKLMPVQYIPIVEFGCMIDIMSSVYNTANVTPQEEKTKEEIEEKKQIIIPLCQKNKK